MNAERLLAHYERIADAPDAVARLRRFILDLAVRGKLVPQDPHDEPVAELLKRIAKAKAERKKKTGDARIKIEPDPSPEELNMPLPLGWAVQSFENLFLFIDYRGNTPPKTDHGIPLITAKNIRMGYLNREPREYVSNATFNTWMTRGFPEIGDLFFTTEAPLANICLNDIEEPFALAQRAICFQPYAEIDTKFLMFALMSDVMQSLIDKHSTGMTAKGIKAANLKPLPIPLPPLAEQRRIVAKVDELMGLCDRLEAARAGREATRDQLAAASLARLNTPDPETFKDDARFALEALPALTSRPDQIKALRQTILNLAVRGKLVPQDPNDEPASELLKQIAADKADRASSARDRRAAKIRPLAGEEVPFPVPPNWLWAAFGDITISRDGERIPVSREEREQRARVYDYYGASGVIDKIDGFLFDTPLLLIGEDGANLINRSTPIAFIARGKYWVNNHAHVLDGLSEGFLRYVELFINAIDLKPYVTGTAQPKMNQAKMNSIPVALPPLAEQQRIVAKVDALMALCDRLEASLTATAATRRRLLDALLAEALAPSETAERAAAE